MTRTLISLVVFLAGLAVAGWIGAGYIGTNPLALAVVALIAIVYLTGVVELQRYQRGTDSLARAVNGLTAAPTSLDSWLSQLQPGLRGATRLRIEGQRVALPGPTLTPYLVGLLVLLGMLGTFLGMVATLRGTGIALESASDLQAIRASLAAPVKGLGFAFGTSVAGVATSAALGLLATICRRARIQAAQQLDVMIATTLRPYSQNHQGEQTYKLMQQQAEAMPALVERLQHMMTAMEKQSLALHDRLAASQDDFYSRTETAYTGLASSLEQSLKQSVIDNARAAGEAIQPAVQATLAGLARETSAWQDTLAISIRQQLESLSGRFEATTSSVADIWNQALTQQQQTNSQLAKDNQQALGIAVEQFAQHTSALLLNVDQSHADLQSKLAAHDTQRLDTWKAALAEVASDLNRSFDGVAATLQSSLTGITTSLDASLKDTASAMRDEWQHASAHATDRQQAICETLAQTAQQLTEQTQAHARDTITEVSQLLHNVSEAPKAAAAVITELRQSHEDLQARLIAQDQQRLDNWKASLDHIASNWNTTLESTSGALTQSLENTASSLATSLAGTTSSLTSALESTASTLSTSLTDTTSTLHSSFEGITASLDAALQRTTSSLREEWTQTSVQTTERQQAICETLSQTAQQLTAQTQAHARDTITEVSRLLHTASEAPKAAAAVITELRQSHEDLQAKLIAQDQQRLDSWKASLDHIASNWNTTLEATAGALNTSLSTTADALKSSLGQTTDVLSASLEQTTGKLSTSLEKTTDTLSTSLEKTTGALSASMEDTAASLNASLTGTTSTLTVTLENTASTLHNAFDDIASSMNVALENTAYTLRQEWEQASTEAANRQQAICDTLAQTAQELSSHTQTQARDTIAEVAQLVQTAAEAPRAAASVISELRQKLSDGMARDNELLDERNRLMDTLSTLLDAVNHASTQQRDAVDSLISNSSELLERIGSQFTGNVQAEAGKLTDAAATITGSAVEVASLGEAFGAAVQVFSQSNDKLVAHLERIEAALDKSMTRSDEQLAYYVAQAREVVDLSVMSQKQIIEDLQLLAAHQAPATGESA